MPRPADARTPARPGPWRARPSTSTLASMSRSACRLAVGAPGHQHGPGARRHHGQRRSIHHRRVQITRQAGIAVARRHAPQCAGRPRAVATSGVTVPSTSQAERSGANSAAQPWFCANAENALPVAATGGCDNLGKRPHWPPHHSGAKPSTARKAASSVRRQARDAGFGTQKSWRAAFRPAGKSGDSVCANPSDAASNALASMGWSASKSNS